MYNFSIRDVLHDSAAVLTPGEPLQQFAYPGFDSGLYRFDGQAGNQASISLSSVDPEWYTDVARWTLIDPDGNAVADECGFIGAEHPTPMSILTARTINDGDLSDLMHETTLSFQTTPGHRYMAMGYLSVRAQDGGVIDFFNTFRVTDIDVRAGVLRSAATGGDLADAFGPPANGVPLPGTLWLLLASAAGAFASRPRRWARAGQAGQ